MSVLLVLALVGVVLTAPAVAQTDAVKENEVDIDGSTITITTGGANAVAVEDLPETVTITSVSDAGIYNQDQRSILYTDLNDGLPDTVTFTMDPEDETYTSDSNTVSFTVGDESVSLTVVGQPNDSDDGSSNGESNDDSVDGSELNDDEPSDTDDSTEADDQVDEENGGSAGSDTGQPADDGETGTENAGSEVSVEEAVQQVEELDPDTASEITIENEGDGEEGTTVSTDETETVEEVTFSDESVNGAVEVKEYTEPPEDVATQVAKSIAQDIDAGEDTQVESDSVNDQNSDENEGDSTTSSPDNTNSDSNSADADSGNSIADTSGESVDVVSMADISPSSDSGAETEARVTFTVDSDRVTSPSNVFITHETDQGWEQLETTVEDQSNGIITLSAQTESFSLFAVVEVADIRDTTDNTESSSEPDNPDKSLPIIFIVGGLAIVAVVSGVAYWQH